MGQADLSVSSDQIYTMRELNHDTADVLRKINESGRPAIITRHGRFIAMVTPLIGSNVESAALSALVDDGQEISVAQARGQEVVEHLINSTSIDVHER